MEQRQPSILTTNSNHFWWMTLRRRAWGGCTAQFEQSFIGCVQISFIFKSCLKRFPRRLFRHSCPVACGFSSDTSRWCCRVRDKCFFPSLFVLLNDGADKKRDDIDGERSAQPRGGEEAHRRAGELGAGGPGKFPAQRTAEPENNFGFPPWQSRGHPEQRQIWDWQPFRHAPQQRQRVFGGHYFIGKQKENEHLFRSFTWFRH